MRKLLTCILYSGLFCCTSFTAEDLYLQATLEVSSGRGSKPMVALWLEDAKGGFVETVQVCGKKAKYYKRLSEWQQARRDRENRIVDAVVGASIRWSGRRVIDIPVRRNGRNLLDGNHVLRVESNAEDKRHYRDFRIPVPADFKGGVFQHQGYVSRVTLRVVRGKGEGRK